MSIYAQIKICSKCGIEKPLSDFNKRKRNKDGLNSYCRECVSLENKSYRKNNQEKIKIKKKEWYQENRETAIQKVKDRVAKNKESISEYKKEWYQKNKKLIIKKGLKRKHERYHNDILYKIKDRTRNIVYKSLKRKGHKKNSRTFEILGCDYETLKEHIESQFDDNMNWDNYGTYWDIDHIIPLKSGETEEDIIKLNHYTNLQPLESYFNRHIKRGNIL
jgi:hypothetical protein